MSSTIATAEDPTMRCKYSSKPCREPRALKKTGELHNFCEFHRSMANRNQRRSDQKRRHRRQLQYANMLTEQKNENDAEDAAQHTQSENPSHSGELYSYGSPMGIDEDDAMMDEDDYDYEPFQHPVSLNEEDLECLFMTVVERDVQMIV
ncbi:hypothetical protein Poli38472_011646 [Pythium oligandrum]|uniref:Uncharacterized protein n=1 Tax=Pythium oligandrum TaxID=41045 RepID=A0A8K1CL84_PYTOL|nr:hypothetical protein Poli38472_011646 [Pythium oligandrum]|eukprot:TMW64766.1 hypothetical protein Poli38472_011646 [Pythium oligandrum]